MQSISSYFVKLLNIVNPVSSRLPIKKPFTYMVKPQHSVVIIQPEMVAIASGAMPDKTDKQSRFIGQEVAAFEIGKYAVTVAQWQAVMGRLPRGNDELSSEQPVMNVNWYDVQNFITKLNQLTGKTYRLPTELEWEYAVRASSTEDYYFHHSELHHINRDRDKVNYDKNRDGTVVVGSLPPNPWGLHEMLGNIWEWVDYTKTKGFNPNAVYDESCHILRGGCWASSSFEIRLTAQTEHGNNECGWNSFGFRLAL